MGDSVCVCDVCTFNGEVYESTLNNGDNIGILRTIKGPVAEWDKLNRNKRKYSEKLWDKVLASQYVQEQLRYHTLYGEAGHPTDRYEVDFSRVSHSITALWKVPATNQIYATIEILDTPLGRILNTLYDAGGVIGYSSRASGSLTPRKGYTDVDENTYNFVTFDAVPFPSVESARPPIVEGKEMDIPKASLSEDVHEKLCKIINESTLEHREVIKSLIYNLEGYDFSKEISLLEGNTPSYNLGENGQKAETTMSLLKESSLMIDRLRSENQSLQTMKNSLLEENQMLRKNLSSSLSSISRLMNESKKPETRIIESNSNSDDTIKGLKSKINDLNEELYEKDLEIEQLNGVYVALRAVNEEKKRLEYEITSLRNNISESESIENLKLKKELDEVYKEVSVLIGESNQKDLRISELDNSVDNLKNQLSVLESKNISENENKINSLANENRRLMNQVSELNESLSDINKSLEDVSARSDLYKNELISVISSRYNLTVESVKAELPVGFTKSDIYSVCESMSNSVSRKVPYSNIISESLVSHVKEKESVKLSPRISFVDRRGRGLK